MKKMKKFQFVLFVILVSSIGLKAQKLLSLEAAVALALENNFDIRIARNELKIDAANVTIGHAGMLPRVNGIVTNNNTILNTNQTFANGNEVEIDGAKNLNINYGIGLEWTLFDGFSMFARHHQLKALQELGETTLRLSILTKISQVYETYFQLVNLQQLLKNSDSIIAVSKFRLQTAQNRFVIGKASKLDVLNAEVDYNTDVVTKIQLNEQFAIAKIQLNELIVQPADSDFVVAPILLIDDTLQLEALKTSAKTQNPELQLQLINKKIQEYELKQIKANRYPRLNLTTGYNLVRSQTPFGFVTESTGRNFNYGFVASLNLFDGFNQTRNEKTSKLQLENSQLQIEKQTQTILAQISALYQTYLANLSLLTMEQKNEKIAKQNLDITVEKYKIGSISQVEFRTAQVNYTTAVIRLASAEMNAKQTEINLKLVAGNLSL